jgi:hypothetical protein
MAAVAEPHTVVAVAVHTAIAKTSASRKGSSLTGEAGPSLSSPPEADPQASAQLSLRSRV